MPDKLAQFSARFWEFPPQEWFEPASAEDWPSCLLMENPLKQTSLSSDVAAIIIEVLSECSDDKLLFRGKDPNERKQLATPNGPRFLAKYNFTEETLRETMYNHICLILSFDEQAAASLQKGGKIARKRLKAALSDAMKELTARNHSIFTSPEEEVAEDTQGMTASIMEGSSCFPSHHGSFHHIIVCSNSEFNERSLSARVPCPLSSK